MKEVKRVYKETNGQDGFNIELQDGVKIEISDTDWNSEDRKENYDSGIIYHDNSGDIFFTKDNILSINLL